MRILLFFILIGVSLVLTLSSVSISIQEENENKFDFKALQEMNLTLGKSIYVEKFILPEESQNKNIFENDTYSFSGSGMLNDIEISSMGNGIILSREDNTHSITGKGMFKSLENGMASYSFEEIAYSGENTSKHLGAAFFDSNATGNLEFLKSNVGIYKVYLDREGTFVMWELK